MMMTTLTGAQSSPADLSQNIGLHPMFNEKRQTLTDGGGCRGNLDWRARRRNVRLASRRPAAEFTGTRCAAVPRRLISLISISLTVSDSGEFAFQRNGAFSRNATWLLLRPAGGPIFITPADIHPTCHPPPHSLLVNFPCPQRSPKCTLNTFTPTSPPGALWVV